MGVQAVAISPDGQELAAFETFDELFQFERAHRHSGIEIKKVPDSAMWDADYRGFVERKIYPTIFDSDEEFELKMQELNPYFHYKNSVRNMLSQYTTKFVVLVKEGTINEDDVGDDFFVTMYIAHNMDWARDFVRNFASGCGAEVAIYHVNHDGNVVRLFKEWTTNKKAFSVFTDKKHRYDYAMYRCDFKALGWKIASVD